MLDCLIEKVNHHGERGSFSVALDPTRIETFASPFGLVPGKQA
jgi:hypothetical protein